MKKIVLLIFLLINLSGFAQSYYCTKNITLTDCKLNFINNVPVKWAQLDATLMTWSVDQVGSYIIKDGVTQVTIKNDGCLISPTFTNLDDSLIAWQSRCLSSGGATIPIPLSVNNVGIDTVRVLDSVRVWFEQGLDTSNQGILNGIFGILRDSLDKNVFINNDSLRVWFEQKNDTIDFEYKTYCYRGKSDSGVYSLNVVFSALTPYAPIFMNFLNVDSLSEIFRIDNRLGVTFGTFPNIPQDYVPCEKWNEYLIANSKKDTTKGLVYTQIAKVRTDRDTLFNCKSLSFGRKGGASGNLILTYENGESETFNIATDDLPSWVNGEFLSYLDYNATGTTGLIVNTVGCSQTSDNICAKVKPVFDCELNIPIQCLGWQSASGVWQTASGCWNTGQ